MKNQKEEKRHHTETLCLEKWFMSISLNVDLMNGFQALV
jgi:hypothetical protein